MLSFPNRFFSDVIVGKMKGSLWGGVSDGTSSLNTVPRLSVFYINSCYLSVCESPTGKVEAREERNFCYDDTFQRTNALLQDNVTLVAYCSSDKGCNLFGCGSIETTAVFSSWSSVRINDKVVIDWRQILNGTLETDDVIVVPVVEYSCTRYHKWRNHMIMISLEFWLASSPSLSLNAVATNVTKKFVQTRL